MERHQDSANYARKAGAKEGNWCPVIGQKETEEEKAIRLTAHGYLQPSARLEAAYQQ